MLLILIIRSTVWLIVCFLVFLGFFFISLGFFCFCFLFGGGGIGWFSKKNCILITLNVNYSYQAFIHEPIHYFLLSQYIKAFAPAVKVICNQNLLPMSGQFHSRWFRVFFYKL